MFDSHLGFCVSAFPAWIPLETYVTDFWIFTFPWKFTHCYMYENPRLYSMFIEFDVFKKEVYTDLEFRKSSLEATNKALKTVKMNGKCKKLDLLTVKKQIKPKSKGF